MSKDRLFCKYIYNKWAFLPKHWRKLLEQGMDCSEIEKHLSIQLLHFSQLSGNQINDDTLKMKCAGPRFWQVNSVIN